METPAPLPSATIISDQITRDYQIIRCIGRGGMGHVYLAEQLRVGRRLVALKVLNRQCADNPQVAKRFEAEAATAGLIHHRNVVTIYESRITDDGQIYVAMEYVHGRTLHEVLNERKCLPLPEVVAITKQVCAGLQAAHKLGIVHRDIKPDNIMLAHDEDGLTVKVLDFGIARLSEVQAAEVHTTPGLVLGTPVYMSPEQAAGQIGEQIDARSDIYSLGMVVYEMLVGRTPFTGTTYPAILHQHLYETPALPSSCAQEGKLTPAIDEVLMSALAKDRRRRPAQIIDFARALETACAQACEEAVASTERSLPQRAPMSVPSAPLDPPTMAVAPHRRLGLTLSALAVLVFIVLSLWVAGYFNASSQDASHAADTPAPTVAAPPLRQTVLDYRLLQRGRNDEPEPLRSDHAAPLGELLLFGVRPLQPLNLYLFEEQLDGSWLWFDAKADGRASLSAANQWSELPRGRWYVFDAPARFWLVCVPEGLSWTLTGFTEEPRIALHREEKLRGSATLTPDAVARLRAWLEKEGLKLEAASAADSNATQLQQAGASGRVAYYQIAIKQSE
jgi:serine/threonine protein kinase